MNLSEFKVRWMRSKINPVLFYLPVNLKKKKKKLKATFKINPQTYINSNNYFAADDNKTILFQHFTVENESKTTGGNSYCGLYGAAAEPSYGCKYRLYKLDEETGTIIGVTSQGEDDPEEKTKLLSNKTTVTLPIGKYYYKEYISAEGDCLFFEIPEIEIFQKDDDWIINHPNDNDVIKDYPVEETPTNPNTVYIRYLNYDDNKLHETYSGYRGYKIISAGTGSLEEEDYDIFNYKIYHKPKLIKTYISYEDVTEATPATNEYYGNFGKPGYSYWYRQPFDSIGWAEDSSKDNLVENPIHVIVPNISKIEMMDKDITSEVSIEKKNILRNNTKATAYIGHVGDRWAGGVRYKCAELTYPDSYSHKALVISGITVCDSFLMTYAPYRINNYLAPRSGNEDYYEDTTETYFYPYTSFPEAPNVGTVLAIEFEFCNASYSLYDYFCISRGHTIVTYYDDGSEKSVGASWNPTAATIEKKTYVNNAIIELKITTGKQASGIGTGKIMKKHMLRPPYPYGITDEQYDALGSDEYWELVLRGPEYPSKHVKGFVSAEDSAQIPVWICDRLSRKDPDNPDGYAPLYASENAPTYQRMTFYEKTGEKKPKHIFVEAFGYSSNMQMHTSYLEAKVKQTLAGPHHDYTHLDAVKDCTEACGAIVLFTRQTRDGYKQWHNTPELMPTLSDNKHYGITD